MIRYRNVQTGRELDLPESDPAFESSEGWEEVEITDPKPLGYFDPKPLYTPPAKKPDWVKAGFDSEAEFQGPVLEEDEGDED